jgi:DNA-binding Xre family transcriptional regulator
MTGIAASTFSRMRKNEYISLEILARICVALNCQLSDAVEVLIESNKDETETKGNQNG